MLSSWQREILLKWIPLTQQEGMVYLCVWFLSEKNRLNLLHCIVGFPLRTPLPSDADFKQKLRCSRKPATFDLEFEQDVLNVIVGCSNDSEAARGNIESWFHTISPGTEFNSANQPKILLCTDLYFLLFPFPNIGLLLLYFLKMNCENIQVHICNKLTLQYWEKGKGESTD